MNQRVKVLAAVFLALVVSMAMASPAQAERSAKGITESVMKSSNPTKAFKQLPKKEREAFLKAFANQRAVTTASYGGVWKPTAKELAAMQTSDAPAELQSAVVSAAASGCWYHYYEKAWYDFNIHTADTWMQLNWCGSGGRITSWSQSNVGCSGYWGAGCDVGRKTERNVNWEIRSTRYYVAKYAGVTTNSVCMQIRGGATGLYSKRWRGGSTCSLD